MVWFKVQPGPSGDQQKKIRAEIVRKLKDLMYEIELGTLKEGQANWIRILNNNFAKNGDLTAREREVLADIYAEVMK